MAAYKYLENMYNELADRFNKLEALYKKTRQLLISSVERYKDSQAKYTLLHEELLDVEQKHNHLRQAIIKHRDLQEHDRCWFDDDELYASLGEPVKDRPLPTRDCFLKNCAIFFDKRDHGSAQHWRVLNRLHFLQSLKDVYNRALTAEQELELHNLNEVLVRYDGKANKNSSD